MAAPGTTAAAASGRGASSALSLQDVLLVAASIGPLLLVLAGRRRRMRAVLKAQAAEGQWQSLKQDLLSNVAHELRTPLTPLIAYPALLLQQRLTQDQTAHIARQMINAAEQLEHTVDLLVSYATLSDGRLQIKPELADPAQVVAAAAQDRASRSPERGVVVRVAGRAGRMPFDARLVGMAVDQLVDNAIKFSPDGGMVNVDVRASASSSDEGGGSVVEIVVSDSGIGIDAAAGASVMDEFRQADGSATRSFGGLGLGLALARKVAQMHGGRIILQPRNGGGSVVTMTLPVAEPPAKTHSAPAYSTG